jgi:hypothetical protein
MYDKSILNKEIVKAMLRLFIMRAQVQSHIMRLEFRLRDLNEHLYTTVHTNSWEKI